ncbi:MAG TPA: hypothetical protein DCW90_07850 [Lachnospiraceae bacterium]|nr:hypothetical protein [uncultured Lachnoclostridium sp.]HAU85403.1 hypothetical protein [Lachnospiraceae bacterium]
MNIQECQLKFNACEPFVSHTTDICKTDEGSVLLINTRFQHLCPNHMLLIGVLLYSDNCLFTSCVRKVCTNQLIYDNPASTETFEFLIPPIYSPKTLHIKILSEYIC